MHPVRICHLTSVHNPFDTRIFYKECVALAEAGYDVSLIAPIEKSKTVEGIKIISISRFRSRILRFLISDTEVFYQALLTNAKVYHIHDPELIPHTLMLRLFGKKIIYDIHEWVIEDLKEKQWLKGKGLAASFYSFFEKLACRYFNIIIANKVYNKLYEGRTKSLTLVQNFVDESLISQVSEQNIHDSNSILLVGTLSAYRGLNPLIDALTILKKEGLEINLILVGKKGKEVDEILNSNPNYELVKWQLRFVGYVPLKEAYKYAEACFCGVALLEEVENNRYNYPTKLFEYMAAGLPVIASNFEVNKAVVESNSCGICVHPSSPKELADAIKNLYMNKNLCIEMGRNGKKAVKENYSWQTEKEKLLELYRNMTQ